MSKEELKKAFLNKPKPVASVLLQTYEPHTSNPTPFEYIYTINDPKTILPIDSYDCVRSFQQQYTENLQIIKENAKRILLKRRSVELQAEKSQEKQTKKWIRKMEKIESYNKNHIWIWTPDGYEFVTEEKAEESDVKLYIHPRFLTDPERFSKQATPVSKLVTYKLTNEYNKVPDCKSEHVHYRSDQVWSIPELRVFLHEFFRHPKKFDEIRKFLPEKTTKDIVQLFYLIKYPFRLKKMLRIQSRRRRDDVVADHVKQVIKKVKKMFPGKEWISQEELSNKVSHHKEASAEEYIDKYGKDTSKLNSSSRDFQDYSRYKEYAFGGDRVQDEGPIAGEEIERKGASQWSYEEKMIFIRYYKQVGRNWDEIASKIETKTSSQVRNFFQNYKKKLKLEDVSSEQDEEAILAAAGITNKSK